METDQLLQRLEWIDGERRKDKATIAALEQRVTAAEGNLPGLQQQITELTGQLARMTAQFSRFDDLQNEIIQIRAEQNKNLDAIEKSRLEHDREVDKTRRADLENLNHAIADVRKGLDPIPELKRAIQARTEEEYRLGRLIEELDKKIKDFGRVDEELQRSLKLIDDARRQDSKRMTDLQGETAALRKRMDEQRGKSDVTSDSLRKLEQRFGEMQAADLERRQSMNAFIEKQTLAQVERERTWKDMQVRFDEIASQATGLDAQLQALDATHRAIKRSQEAFDEITLRFERRINEITEMQRLVEDRFRQEWVAFKADDQKRWTNYTLAQDEQQREQTRRFDKFEGRFTALEETSQQLRDLTHLTVEDTQKRLQGLLAQMHTWVEEYDRTFGHTG